MRPVVDLHPDDAAVRERLRAALIRARRDAGLSQRALAARLGRTQPAVQALEVRRSAGWKTGSVQRWAYALHLGLTLNPHGLPTPAPPDGYTAVLLAMSPSHRRARALLVDTLRRVRIRCDITLAELGRRLGCRDNTVAAWELSGADPLLISAQRYARALGEVAGTGGHLAAALHPASDPIPEPVNVKEAEHAR